MISKVECKGHRIRIHNQRSLLIFNHAAFLLLHSKEFMTVQGIEKYVKINLPQSLLEAVLLKIQRRFLVLRQYVIGCRDAEVYA